MDNIKTEQIIMLIEQNRETDTDNNNWFSCNYKTMQKILAKIHNDAINELAIEIINSNRTAGEINRIANKLKMEG